MSPRRTKAPRPDCGCPNEAKSVETKAGRRVCLARTPKGPRFVPRVCPPTAAEGTATSLEVALTRVAVSLAEGAEE